MVSRAPLPLDTTLGRIRLELVDLGRCADQLQVVIGAVVASASSSLAPDMQMQLQAADALSQRLQRLAVLAGGLAVEIPRDWALSPRAADRVAHLLSHLVHPDGVTASLPPQDQGDCEFF